MRRPARLGSRRGLLLLEAVLSAVVVVVGLVFITRALGGQLGALRRIEEADATLALARGKLLEWESRRLAGLPPADREGAFDEPFAGYRWVLSAEPRADVTKTDGSPAAADATLTVERESPPASSTTLTAVWPANWTQ
ncbi:MAG: hypothetical protein A3B78_01000 [Omnitrophica WOR_2 bacterium RIFCSPHIGHO2_02_FULL_67_20]|nr:MAG: hypothetical protein A3B78_01000 [Omnitrophica WOR_2 bacterium RIFCSPHIGHO2_02_FULL_67_20]